MLLELLPCRRASRVVCKSIPMAAWLEENIVRIARSHCVRNCRIAWLFPARSFSRFTPFTSCVHKSTMRLTKSSRSRCVSPAVAFTSITHHRLSEKTHRKKHRPYRIDEASKFVYSSKNEFMNSTEQTRISNKKKKEIVIDIQHASVAITQKAVYSEIQGSHNRRSCEYPLSNPNDVSVGEVLVVIWVATTSSHTP